MKKEDLALLMRALAAIMQGDKNYYAIHDDLVKRANELQEDFIPVA